MNENKRNFKLTKAGGGPGGVLRNNWRCSAKQLFQKISQKSQKNDFLGVSFKLSCKT